MKEQLRILDKKLYRLSVRITYGIIFIFVALIVNILPIFEEFQLMLFMLIGVVAIVMITVWILKTIDLTRRVIGNIVDNEMKEKAL